MSTGGGIVIESSNNDDGLNLSSGGSTQTNVKAPEKLLGKALKKTIVSSDQVVANINPSSCINCGTCRENCPTEAIEENQRAICHVCPTCTEISGISVNKMYALSTETSCTTSCPLGISPQGYLGLTKARKYDAAYQLIWDKNPLPSVCGRICHHPCEEGCKRGILVDYPIKIREMKKYLSQTVNYTPEKYVQLYEEKVAIVGAGPAGLTAGHYLALSGYDVTIFEGATEAGGMLLRGIPEFRLSREAVRHDIQKLKDAGLKIELNQKLNKYSLEKLKTEYDVIIVAAGTPNSKELFIEGFRLAGVMTAMNFMEHVNNHQKLRRHLGQLFKFDDGKAVIIGGGSVAIDCARTAIRSGASKVTVVCLEQGDAVPAHQWEVDEALAEGVEIIEGYGPVEYTCKLFPTLTGVKFEKVKSMGKDASGKFELVTDPNQSMVIDCDWAIEAIGQYGDSFWKDIAEEGVFFAGDMVSNKCSVIDAMASGRKAALDVDAAIQGRALRDPVANKENRLKLAPVMEKLFPYNFRKIRRPETKLINVAERVENFDEFEGVFTDTDAFKEADSCLACGYEVVDSEKCIGCGICAKLCPKGDVITLIAKENGGETR